MIEPTMFESVPALRPMTIQDAKAELKQIIEEAKHDRAYQDGKVAAFEEVLSILNRQT